MALCAATGAVVLHPDPFTRRVHPFPAAVIVGYGFAVRVPSIPISGSAFGEPNPRHLPHGVPRIKYDPVCGGPLKTKVSVGF